MSETKINREDQYLIDLKNGKSFFPFVPNDIGDIIYCDSTREESKTAQMVFGIILCIASPSVATYVFIHGFDSSTGGMIFLLLLAVIALVFGIASLATVNYDNDFFIGESGFSFVNYKKGAITNHDTYYFRDFVSVYMKLTDVYTNNVYQHTDYNITVYDESKCLLDYDSTYNQEHKDGRWKDTSFRFWNKVESVWTEYKLAQYVEDLEYGRPVVFNTLESADDNKIVFTNSGLYVFGVFFAKDMVSNFYFQSGYFLIEHVNFSSKLFGLIKKGDRFKIPLSQIANRTLFVLFFKHFVNA